MLVLVCSILASRKTQCVSEDDYVILYLLIMIEYWKLGTPSLLLISSVFCTHLLLLDLGRECREEVVVVDGTIDAF